MRVREREIVFVRELFEEGYGGRDKLKKREKKGETDLLNF